MNEDAIRVFSAKPKTFSELHEKILEIDKITKTGFDKIIQWIDSEWPYLTTLRNWSVRFIIISLISIILIILKESESISFLFELIHKVYSFLEEYFIDNIILLN